MAYVEYTPTTYSSSDYVTPTSLNHAEQGIKNANDYAREIYTPTELFTITPDANETYSTLFNKIYAQLSNLPISVVADGYLQIGDNIFRLDRISSSLYGFASQYLSNDGAVNNLVAQAKSSSSTYRRLYITTAGVINTSDQSSSSVSDNAIFYGRS